MLRALACSLRSRGLMGRMEGIMTGHGPEGALWPENAGHCAIHAITRNHRQPPPQRNPHHLNELKSATCNHTPATVVGLAPALHRGDKGNDRIKDGPTEMV